MNKFSKIFLKITGAFIKKLVYINVDYYMTCYTKLLRRMGVKIEGNPKFISPDVYFDGNNYSKIRIGNNVTISREVMILTHDYSITTAMASVGKIIERHHGEMFFSREVSIGENCFVGARSSILPGTIIGDNVIIGACSVVKGKVPNNSIIIGNPYKIIGNTKEWVMRQQELNDYFVEH